MRGTVLTGAAVLALAAATTAVADVEVVINNAVDVVTNNAVDVVTNNAVDVVTNNAVDVVTNKVVTNEDVWPVVGRQASRTDDAFPNASGGEAAAPGRQTLAAEGSSTRADFDRAVGDHAGGNEGVDDRGIDDRLTDDPDVDHRDGGGGSDDQPRGMAVHNQPHGRQLAAAASSSLDREISQRQPMATGGVADGGDARAGIHALGDGPHYVEVGLGAFDVLREEAGARRSAGGSLEFRGGDKLWFIGPAAGVVVNADGGLYGYGGIYADLKWGSVVLTPQAGIGAYHQGDSSDLGGVVQFRVGAGLSYQFASGWRIGVSFAHISNAGLYQDNGGAEELYLIVALPFSL